MTERVGREERALGEGSSPEVNSGGSGAAWP